MLWFDLGYYRQWFDEDMVWGFLWLYVTDNCL